MSEATRDPRKVGATAASNATVTGLVGLGLPVLFPDMTPQVAALILGGLIVGSTGLGHLARDWVHECEVQEPPRRPSFFVRKLGDYLG